MYRSGDLCLVGGKSLIESRYLCVPWLGSFRGPLWSTVLNATKVLNPRANPTSLQTVLFDMRIAMFFRLLSTVTLDFTSSETGRGGYY